MRPCLNTKEASPPVSVVSSENCEFQVLLQQSIRMDLRLGTSFLECRRVERLLRSPVGSPTNSGTILECPASLRKIRNCPTCVLLAQTQITPDFWLCRNFLHNIHEYLIIFQLTALEAALRLHCNGVLLAENLDKFRLPFSCQDRT